MKFLIFILILIILPTVTKMSEQELSSENRQMTLFTPKEMDQIARYLVLNQRRQRENLIMPRTFTPIVMKNDNEKMVEAAFESCAFKSLLSCVAGMLE